MKACATRICNLDFAASVLAVRSGMGLPCGFFRGIPLTWPFRHSQCSFAWLRQAVARTSHISIDLRYGFIRKATVTSAADSDERQLRRVVDTGHAAGDVRADSAYRSKKNEAWLKSNIFKSRIHRRKPQGKPMPEHIVRANAPKSGIQARGEHVFADQENHYGLFIRTIGLARAQAKLTPVNLAYNFDRPIFRERRAVTG